MFEENKYCKWYMELIDKARKPRDIDVSEKHHVVPRCMGGNNSKENTVDLTPREHYIAHLLLPKCVKDPIHKSKMAYALFRFGGKNLHSRVFGRLRSSYVRMVSGEGNAFYGKKHSKESISKMSGKNHHMYGRKHSPSSIQKMRKNTKGMVGEQNPMFGKPRTKRQRENQSREISGRIQVEKDGVVRSLKQEQVGVFKMDGWLPVKKPKVYKKFVVEFENGNMDESRKLIDLSRKYGWNYSSLRSGLSKGRFPEGVISIRKVTP